MVVAILVGISGLAASCTKGVRLDTAMAAIEAGDKTAPIEGCGQQLQDGVLVCRKTEGDASQDQIVFVGPPAECAGKDPCVTFKIFYPDGSPSYAGSIPRGMTRIPVPWEQLLKRSTFEKNDRGFWGYSYAIRYLGPDGKERMTYSDGFIFLVVTSQGYTSLHELPDDPNYAWSWVEDGAQVKLTTGARVYVARRK